MNNRKNNKNYAISRFKALFIYICIALCLASYVNATPQVPGTELINTKFNLTNQFNEKVTEQDYLGKYQIIFFGFTSCPLICPTALGKIDAALLDLGDLKEHILRKRLIKRKILAQPHLELHFIEFQKFKATIFNLNNWLK